MNLSFIKQRLLDRAKIAGYILALVGWFMLCVVLFGSLFEDQLIRIESFVESAEFMWSLRAIVIILVVALFKGRGRLGQLREKHPWLKPVLRVYLIGGGIGWAVGLGSLLF